MMLELLESWNDAEVKCEMIAYMFQILLSVKSTHPDTQDKIQHIENTIDLLKSENIVDWL